MVKQEKMKARRKALGMTLDDVASHFNVSPQSISRWENGHTYISPERYQQLADLFDCTVEEITETPYVLSKDCFDELIREMEDFAESLRKHRNRKRDTTSNNARKTSIVPETYAEQMHEYFEKIALLSDENRLRLFERIDTMLEMQEDNRIE